MPMPTAGIHPAEFDRERHGPDGTWKRHHGQQHGAPATTIKHDTYSVEHASKLGKDEKGLKKVARGEREKYESGLGLDIGAGLILGGGEVDQHKPEHAHAHGHSDYHHEEGHHYNHHYARTEDYESGLGLGVGAGVVLEGGEVYKPEHAHKSPYHHHEGHQHNHYESRDAEYRDGEGHDSKHEHEHEHVHNHGHSNGGGQWKGQNEHQHKWQHGGEGGASYPQHQGKGQGYESESESGLGLGVGVGMGLGDILASDGLSCGYHCSEGNVGSEYKKRMVYNDDDDEKKKGHVQKGHSHLLPECNEGENCHL